MPAPQAASRDPQVFSRGSLKLTYDLLRKKNPSLALIIRNITAEEPLPKADNEVQNPNSDHFKVKLDSFKVREVVEELIMATQKSGNPGNIGMEIIAKTLMEDWLALAHKMISELPEDQRPS